MNYLRLLLCALFLVTCNISSAADVDSLIFQGADQHYRGKLDEALASFQEAVKLDPRNEYAHNQLGIIYAKKERFNDAFREFTLVAEIDQTNTFALLWLGILNLQKNNLDKGFENFQKIIQVDPTNADAYYYLGAIYNIRHNPAKAIEYLKKSRDANSGEADTHFRLGKAFRQVDMVKNAELEYGRVLELNTAYNAARNELGWIYYNAGDFTAAFAEWQQSLKLNPRDSDAVFSLARGYNELAWKAYKDGNKQGASSYWKKVLTVDPDNKAAKYYLGKQTK
jgi:tetratricopeptide (TPR) repeat protein